MSFFPELKRRNVFRVAVGYLAGAWLLIQVLETLLPIFGLPETMARTIVVLLGIGFVPTLVITWFFEVTPEGIVRDSGEQPAMGRSRTFDRVVVAVLAVALMYFAVDKFVLDPRRDAALVEELQQDRVDDATAEASIAVLPFVDLSPEGDQSYFSEGIAEEILNVLAGIDGLHVASRTSSFLFRNKDKSIPVIAETLGVAHVLEGSVRKAGNRVRVTAQLIRGDSDAHLWSNTWDRELSTENLFAIQDEIASAIVGELGKALNIDPATRVAVAASTANLDAYDLYLRSLTVGAIWSTASTIEQVTLLERAVENDPAFVDAWCRLADTRVHLHTWDHDLAPETSVPRAMDAARRCLTLDSSNQRGWAALRAGHFYLHDWEALEDVIAEARSNSPDFLVEATH